MQETLSDHELETEYLMEVKKYRALSNEFTRIRRELRVSSARQTILSEQMAGRTRENFDDLELQQLKRNAGNGKI